jgi:hypothetical protein
MILLMSGATSPPSASWVLVFACLGGIGIYSGYLWLVEVPRLKVLWDQQ